MIERIRKFLQLPVFDDPARNIQAQNVFLILVTLFILTSLYFVYAIIMASADQAILAAIFLAMEIGLQEVLRRGKIEIVGILLSSLFWVTLLIQIVVYGGIRDASFAAFVIVIAISTLTLGLRSGIVFTVLSILAAIGMIIAEQNGVLAPPPPAPLSFLFVVYTTVFIILLMVLYLAMRSITITAQLARQREAAQGEINRQLEESRTQLQERTTALERRTAALQAAADLTRLASQATDVNALLDEAARLIAERLGYLHVGIFLTEANEEFLVLRAANSEAGQALIADNYQLRMARGELAFLAAGTELLRYRIGNQIFRLASPIPITGVRGNISFPLIAGRRLIGLLNIQTSTAVPDQDEQDILRTLADQLAISLENIRLFAQSQERLAEISTLVGKTVRQAWEEVRRGATIGYAYDRLQLMPAGETLPPEVLRELKSGKSVSYVTVGEEPHSRLIAPLVLREQVIGILGYEDLDPARQWQEDEKILLETISSQVSLALENSRLVAEARQRAEREATISEIVGRISGEVDMDSILQTTIKEMSRLVGESEIAVQLMPGAQKEQR
jgi:GAF domain-containing protein